MAKDEAEFVRRRQEKEERRARRKLTLRHKSKNDASDRSLIRENSHPSRTWTGGYGSTPFAHTDRIDVASRFDFLNAVDHEVLDATIKAGLALKDPDRARVELSFAIVRKARLFKTPKNNLLDDVVRWNADAALPRMYGGAQSREWTVEDVYLIRATAAFLTGTGQSLGASYCHDLEWLRSNSNDAYIRAESRLVLAQNHLYEALRSRKRRQSLVERAANTVSRIFQRSRPYSETVRELLDELLQAEIYSAVTVSRYRVRLASSWLDRDPLKALHALDPRRAKPLPPSDEDPGRTQAILAVEKVSSLAHEGAKSAVGSIKRKCFTRALSAAEVINAEALEQADVVRLARALEIIAFSHPDGSWRAGHLLFHLCPRPHLESVSGSSESRV